MEDQLDAFRAYLKSDEGKASMEEYFGKLANEKKIQQSQLKRFHAKFKNNFEFIVEKIQAKYDSKKYQDSWYNRGIEPPETLISFLFEYSCKYGRQCTKKEYKKYANMFTGELRFCKGYYFNLMHGQGSVIHVIKEYEEEKPFYS